VSVAGTHRQLTELLPSRQGLYPSGLTAEIVQPNVFCELRLAYRTTLSCLSSGHIACGVGHRRFLGFPARCFDELWASASSPGGVTLYNRTDSEM